MHNGIKLYSSLLQLSRYKSKALSFLVTYEDIRSPAMKRTKHIRVVNNLVEEINNIIKEKERNFRLWNMIYN